MAIVQKLDQLVLVLEQHGFSIRNCLQSGLQIADINAHLLPIGISIPPDLYMLYQWSNGTIEGCETSLFDEHYFLPIGDAVYEYNTLITIYQESSELFDIDFAACFPFASFMGSYYVMYCKPQPIQGFVNPIIRLFEDVHISFQDLEAMVHTITNWYTSGAYDKRTKDEQLKKSIWRQLNPGIHIP